ncbi:uncharacterized protein PG986_010148 [Apiospora aurea]|uniref:Uncharacterized protein n=1 Tax=Apiospora aurea TaxID=335848 RepID=A0ABR1Q9M9_9PEZI
MRKRESITKELLDVHTQFQNDWAAGLHRHCTAANATPAEKAACESEIQKTIAHAQNSAIAAGLKADHRLLYTGTTQDVFGRILGIIPAPPFGSRSSAHLECTPWRQISDRLWQVTNNIEGPMDEEHEKFLDRRGKLTGMDELYLDEYGTYNRRT